VWNKGNLDVAEEIFHPQHTSPSAPTLPPGAEGVKMIATMFRSAFPDYWMTIDHLVAEPDRVAARFSQGGTHQGDLFGIPPTGKTVKFTEMGILRVADGKIVESWYDVDMLGMMQQLGVGG
jgi:predicted ester cyclase